jgi:hypothetical protein
MAKAHQAPTSPSLYERDFYAWALDQAAHLRAGRLAALDLENLAEEIEGLARAEARELRSRYATLLMHLLKWEFQPDQRSTNWAGTIARERVEIEDHLDDNPSLKPCQPELFAKAYRSACTGAAAETKLPLSRFPATCPYTLEQAMDEAFWSGPEQL